MTAERWQRISEIYESVISCPSASRSAVLDEACSSDEDLRLEVESLLRAREEAGSFLSPGDLRIHIRDLSEPEIAPGHTFGRYEILKIIGAGGMGEVYLARDNELDRRVALKVLPVQFTRDNERVARFRREARAASALSHPNIVTIYDIGESAETRYIAAEFIEGRTVRERLAAAKMELTEVLEVAVQCAGALAAAHEAGIVHRDIKPENIMVRRDGVVKIVDFGLAATNEAVSEFLVTATQTGKIFGTPRYMSPEQARGRKLDARTDIFSLGAVLYEMATGRPAFPGATAPEVFAALLGSGPSLPEEDLAGAVPGGLKAILGKALKRDREARYQSMKEFASDLRNFRAQVASGALSSSVGYFGDHAAFLSMPGQKPQSLERHETLRYAPQPKGRTPARHTSLRYLLRQAIPVAALVLIAVLGVLWFVWRGPRIAPESPPMSVVPLTSFEGYKDYGSFSPDGKSIAFSWNGGRGGYGGFLQRDIYVKKIGGGPPIRLTFSQLDETHPAWSPNGRYIAFCRMIDARTPFQRFGIYIVPAAGGAPREITEGSEGVSWSPDGNELAVAGLPPDSGGIFLVRLKTGKRTRVNRSTRYLDEFPAFSPDGRWIAFTRSFDLSESELVVVRSRGGTVRRLTFDHRPVYGEAWTADSKEIVFSSDRGGGGESLWRIPIAGGAPRKVSATL